MSSTGLTDTAIIAVTIGVPSGVIVLIIIFVVGYYSYRHGYILNSWKRRRSKNRSPPILKEEVNDGQINMEILNKKLSMDHPMARIQYSTTSEEHYKVPFPYAVKVTEKPPHHQGPLEMCDNDEYIYHVPKPQGDQQHDLEESDGEESHYNVPKPQEYQEHALEVSDGEESPYNFPKPPGYKQQALKVSDGVESPYNFPKPQGYQQYDTNQHQLSDEEDYYKVPTIDNI